MWTSVLISFGQEVAYAVSEGLIVVDVNTLHDGDPENNFLDRAVTYNPGNRFSGAVDITIAGNYAYLVSETSGLHVIDISRPLAPQWVAVVGSPDIVRGRAVAVQFRYAFVADAEGVTVIDITHPTQPEAVASVEGLDDARDVFPARTYLRKRLRSWRLLPPPARSTTPRR